MTASLRVREQDWITLRKHFAGSFRKGYLVETGAIGLLGENRTDDKHDFLLAKVIWPQEGDIKVAASGALIFDASYIRRAHLEMRAESLAGLITFHTHPTSVERVGFSYYDDEQDPLLIENLIDLHPATSLVSVVVGKNSQCGRWWVGPDEHYPLDQLIVVGEQLAYLPLAGQPAPPPPAPEALFDSAQAVTGAGASGLLARMKIAVVGASGTGSLLCELLARAGCKTIVPVDDDVVEVRNLNRILYATQSDAANKTPKVEVLRRGIEGLGLGCSIIPVYGTILDKEVMNRLRDTDVIFGCVDKAYPRLLISKFAYQYIIPFVDVGSEIGGDEAGIVSLDARASYVAPGRPCLRCTGLVTSRQLRFETLSYEEREREVALGYSDDLVLKQPAVMDLNMHAASWGMMVLRHLLQPVLATPLPVAVTENLVTYTTRKVVTARAAQPDCDICQDNPVAGWGDCGLSIGLDRAAVDRITGRHLEVD